MSFKERTVNADTFLFAFIILFHPVPSLYISYGAGALISLGVNE